jgi:hypothetical protein
MTDGEEPEWRNNRERITYEEGRHVLEAQKSDIDDIDDEALRTVRITAVLLGVGATGVRVIGTSSVNKIVAAMSLFSFLLSLIFGVIVYNESNEVIGPKASYLGRLRRNEMSAPWGDDLLVQFEGVDKQQLNYRRIQRLSPDSLPVFLRSRRLPWSSITTCAWVDGDCPPRRWVTVRPNPHSCRNQSSDLTSSHG